MSKRPLQATDLLRFVLPGEPQLSPQGEIVFVRQEADLQENKHYTTLWLTSTEGAGPRPLTHGHKNDRWPRWSPDGKRLSFVSGRNEQSQIWILERQGGDAYPLETAVPVQSAPVWSPDGRKIAFVGKAFPHPENWITYPGAPADDYARAKQQAEQALSREKKPQDQSASDVKVITRLRHKMDGSGYFGDLRNHIFVVDVPELPGDDTRCRQLTAGNFDHTLPAWSADGQHIYCAACRSADADLLLKQDIWRIDSNSGNLQPVLQWTGNISLIAPSPDGKQVVFVGENQQFARSTSQNLWLIPAQVENLSASDACNLTAELDRPIGTAPSSDVRYGSSNPPIVWRDDIRILFLYGQAGSTCVAEMNLQSGRLQTLWQDPLRAVSAFAAHPQQEGLVLQAGGPMQAEELALLTEGQELQLTDFNRHVYEECQLAECTRFTYSGDQGWPIDAWLFIPPGSKGRERPLPTVLQIHGGPHGVYGSSFFFQTQILASNGIAVVYTNPRGSQSYGQQFAYAVVGDWGGADYRDIMAVVAHLCDQGVSDPERFGIMGWSYGGFMTSWTITQTDRFKAALPGAIVGNRHSFYGNSDIGYFFGEHHFGGTPWEAADKLLERSAINFADRINTPVLFMHGESDLRCPIDQTEQLFTALRRQNKPAVMVRYPKEYHAISQPQHKRDRYQRILSWFSYHLS
ncbi:MAG: S9 family peptidase [Bacillota bacterium]